MRLRAIETADHPEVLRLNAENVSLLSPLDSAGLTRLRQWAERAVLVEVDGRAAGFVLTFGPGVPYESPNYRWFAQAYPGGFTYLDRIVIAAAFRRRGLAAAVYDELEAAAAARGPMTLEVNVEPANTGSLAFHAARGYREVARRGEPGYVVGLMVKDVSRSR